MNTKVDTKAAVEANTAKARNAYFVAEEAYGGGKTTRMAASAAYLALEEARKLEEIEHHARNLRRRMDDLLNRIAYTVSKENDETTKWEPGAGINTLGEVQGNGLDVDRAIAEWAATRAAVKLIKEHK